MNAHTLIAISLGLTCVAALLYASLVVRVLRTRSRSEQTVARAMEMRTEQAQRAAAHTASGLQQASLVAGSRGAGGGGLSAPANGRRTLVRSVSDALATIGMRWFDTRIGKQLVAKEDQLLIEQCGFVDPRARGLFLTTRVICGIGAPLAASMAFGGTDSASVARVFILLFGALCIGFMAPKWVLGRIAANRRQSVVDELPMFIDLLRLLQGVGLSIDQSVQVIVGEFRRVLPVVGQELEIANRQFVTGRTREQSLQRLITTYDNDDLRAVARLIIQVDRHGGAVQEPLKQFADRLREGRRTAMRERIGKLTVKMTTVMITTLLPALLIVTAGPGFIAVIRSLSALAKP
ncbi:tight adherence protein C [Pararobbsia alpina]|uniref:type II secretion system F family protein n=1 Tax=Pararobbsia alpina TaxID=621374 RepID=UPI0039A59D90